MIKEVLKNKEIILETKISRIKIRCIIRPDIDDLCSITYQWSMGGEFFDIDQIVLSKPNNSLENAKKVSRAILKYYEKHLFDVLESMMKQVFWESFFRAEFVLYNKPKESILKEISVISKAVGSRVGHGLMESRLLQPLEPGRPFGISRYKTGNKLITDLNSATKELKTKGNKISITAVCRSFSPPIDIDVFRDNCKRFKLDPNKLIDYVKTNELPKYYELIRANQCTLLTNE